MMRVLISSTPEDLEGHRQVACDVVLELGLEAVMAPPPGDGDEAPDVEACLRRVDDADLLLAIVGWRLGRVPEPELGGDGRRSSTQWEVGRAFDRAKAVLVFMAQENWPEPLRERDPEAGAWMADFRSELRRLAVFFDYEPPDAEPTSPLPGFRAQVHRELLRRRDPRPAGPSPGRRWRLREWPEPEWPELPYPLLLPYTHPALLVGREREVAELRRLLRRPVPILGLHSPSGAGKSSLLTAGLVPALREDGWPVAFDRHPNESGLASRLAGDLLVGGDDDAVADRDYRAFVDRLLEVRFLAGKAPILVLDQFEDLLGRAERDRARARVGILLAASAQRLPGLDEPPCRWLLAYRQEYHGDVVTWLGDVLGEARRQELPGVAELPHSLAGHERFASWALPPLGTPRGDGDRVREATRVFQAAIETPLELRTSQGERRYPWSFAGGDAARLARAFGEARSARPEAPLAPELQVVLARLLEPAGSPGATAPARIVLPEEPGQLIEQALEEHLRRALDAAFPAEWTAPADSPDQVQARTRVLLALRELADVSGRREGGIAADVLARAIGPGGAEILERIATPLTRLVVLEKHPEGWQYVLSHDRMAEVLVRVVEEEGRFTASETLAAFHARLAVDEELLALRRFVALNTDLYRSGESRQATRMPRSHFQRIAANTDALLWRPDHRQWWAACRKQRREDLRRSAVLSVMAGLALVLVSLVAWTWTSRNERRQALLRQIEAGEPEAVISAWELLEADPKVGLEQIRASLGKRAKPLDPLERGLGIVAAERRSATVLKWVELAFPILTADPEEPSRIATAVWALDTFPGRDPRYREPARDWRDRVLEPLRRRRPPPPRPGSTDPGWVRIPAGSFLREIPPDAEGEGASPGEPPRQEVTVSSFRIMDHEVTNAEYRRLVPEHTGDDQAAAPRVSWYAAYTYAAWLGGRLPTEAEWEYAARAGCRYEYCTRKGEPAALDEVGWYIRNVVTPPPRVRQLEPNPWGLYDMYGNLLEWTADGGGDYPDGPQVDPTGSLGSGVRMLRGGSYRHFAIWARTTFRIGFPPEFVNQFFGFRVVLPAESEP